MMGTPFEELEYLAEYLPEEGESVVVTRRAGTLHCEAMPTTQQRDLHAQPEFYGRLAHAETRLRTLVYPVLWTAVLGSFWLCVAVHVLFRVGLAGWYLFLGIALAGAAGAAYWIQQRRREVFCNEVSPMLTWLMRRYHLERFALIGLIRQQSDLRTLLTQATLWVESE